MNTLESDEAYRLWAPTYSEETAISFLDEEFAFELSPPLEGKRLLDAGCGTGRRSMNRTTALTIGVDLSLDMLQAGRASNFAVADVRSLPFQDQSFDVIWCRLVLGHLCDARQAYNELARVSRTGGIILVSDFHAAAVTAGHQRSFLDSSGREHVVKHHVHDNPSHKKMATDAGLMLVAERNGLIGSRVKQFYARAGRLSAYERDRGLPVVAAFLFERTI